MAAILDALQCVRARVLSQLTWPHSGARPRLKPLRPAPKSWLTLSLVGFVALFLGAWWGSTSDSSEANLRAELTATREELRAARKTLRLRARAIEMAESEIELLTKELENIRAAARDPGGPVFAADDLRQRKRTR